MAIEITVPVLPESVLDALLLSWDKQVGDRVSRDEVLVEVETDKIILEVVAPKDGVLTEILEQPGTTVLAGDVLARMETVAAAEAKPETKSEAKPATAIAPEKPPADAMEKTPPIASKQPSAGAVEKTLSATPAKPPADAMEKTPPTASKQPSADTVDKTPSATSTPPSVGAPAVDNTRDDDNSGDKQPPSDAAPPMSPAVRRLVAEHGLNPADIAGSGRGDRLTKEDILNFIGDQVAPDEPVAAPASVAGTPEPDAPKAETAQGREEKREPMSRLRRTIANRLVEAQQNAALLTTFNEVNMQPVLDLRARYKDEFEKTHGTRLGFMSFFVKAGVAALQKFPMVNAYIDGTDIVLHNYHDIGIAVSSPRGLLVPVLRNCESLSFAEIESQIRGFGERARDGKIDLRDLSGGTFTITNGGVFGSLLSTPIVNPPQSAILGMHKIEERPVAEDGQVVIRPMMYLALSYDHRIVDGQEAVGFLVTIKELLEDPAGMLLQL